MKPFFKIISAVIFVFFILILLLSYGISTNKFNNKIITQIEKRIPNSKVNFKEANISLDIFSLGLKIKINKPEIIVDKQNINLRSFTIFSDLKSSFKENYLLQKIEIDFNKNKILDLKKISFFKRVSFLDQTKFLDGNVNGNLIIDQFQKKKVSIKFIGQLKNVSIDAYEDIPFITDLSSNIYFEDKKVLLSDVTGTFGTFSITSQKTTYSIDQRILSGNINISGALKPSLNLNKISSSFLNLNLEKVKNIGGQLTLSSNVDIQFDQDFKIIKDKTLFDLKTNNLKFIYNNKHDFIFDNINSVIKFDRKGKVIANGDFVLNNKKNKFLINRQTINSFFDISINGEINLKETFFKKTDFI
ncbi:MAG: hypothetical protein VW172_01090, partial [Pelagibacteraceae bacterium]